MVEGSMFARKVLLLHLHTKGLNWRVQRKSPDFLWLHNTLETQFPGFCLPVLPGKSADTDETRYCYKKMLNYMVRSEVFSRSEYLQAFLSESDHREFAIIQSEARQLIKPDRVEKMSSPTGRMYCLPDLTPEISPNVLGFLSETQEVLRELHSRSVPLLESLHSTNQRVQAYSLTISHLIYLQSLPSTSTHRLIYSTLHQLLLDWSQYQQELLSLVKSRLQSHFLYRMNDIEAVKMLVRQRDEAFKRFYKDEKALLTKKQKLWDQWGLEEESISPIAADKTAAFGIMLPAESREVEAERHLAEFYHFRVWEEMERLMVRDRDHLTHHFTVFASSLDQKSQFLSSLFRTHALTLSSLCLTP